MYVSESYVCLMPMEARRGDLKQKFMLLASIWVLGIKLSFSGRTVNAQKH